MSHKQMIILRKDLNMRKGKMVAQGAHASMSVFLQCMEKDGENLIFKMDERSEPWLTGRFKKICVSVNSEEELLNLYQKAKDQGILCSLIQDAGLTEFGGVPTYTAIAIGPDTNERIESLTGHLPLL